MHTHVHYPRLKMLCMVLVSILFFLVYTYLYATAPHVFNSPDEAMNAWMIQRIAAGEPLFVPIPEYLHWYEAVGPRASFVQKDVVTPVGFLGMPLVYGIAHKVVPLQNFFMVLTPLFAVVGAWGVYVLAKRVFNERVALISFLLYVALPAVWYYSTRGLFHNIFFTCVWVWSVALLVVGIEQSRMKEFLYFLGSACCAAAAVWVRPSELPWLVVSYATVLVYARLHRSVSRGNSLFFGIVFLIGALSYFLVQYYFLRVPFFGGYSDARNALAGASLGWVSLIMPFGFSFKAIIYNVYQFTGLALWWITIPAVLGMAVVALRWRRGHRREKGLLLFTAVISLFLVVLVYGNWITHDTPGSLAPTIGNAHLRYWLPLYVLCVVWAAYAFDWIALLLLPRVRWVVPVVVVIASLWLSFCAVWRGVDGISAVRAQLFHGSLLQHEVLARTEGDSLIVVDHEDKFIFPNRMVTRVWDFEEMRSVLSLGTTVYYLDVKNETAQKELFERLKNAGMRAQAWGEWPPHVLFKIILEENSELAL